MIGDHIGTNVTVMRNIEGGDISLSDESVEVEEWRTRSHLVLVIENIPSHWMIADLKAFLDRFGNIVKVEIFEDREVDTLYACPLSLSDFRLGKAMDAEK
jgi:hypothetical protein